MKKLNLVCEAKLSVNHGLNEATAPSGKIEAKVTTWGAREGADGRKFNYQPEGFADWAKEFSDTGKPLPMYLNHNDMGMPIGEWYEFMFEDDGMSANGRLFLNTSGGSDLYTVLKESPDLFGGVSVGAYAEEYQWVDENGDMLGDDADPVSEGYFQITKGGLSEVSVVMNPNNEEACISALECIQPDGSINPRNVEKLLREAGVSRKDATTASSIFKKIFEQRDVVKVLEVAPKQSESDAVVDEAEQLLKALQLRELTKALEKRIK
jgi:HK97 family phage prohead protease